MAVDPSQIAAQPPAQDAPPAPAAPEQAPAPEAEASPPTFDYDPEIGPTLHGVPLYNFDNPFGGQGFGILASLDLEAAHESGQKLLVNPGSETPEYEPITKSGGAAYYWDLTLAKGWSVPLNPEGR